MTLAEFQESVNAIIPTPTRLSEPRWFTRWSAQLRQATRYRAGRVFLAGDAAHIHSPAGGQELNTGVQDAYNLSWKLAFVLRGIAPDSLLDTYQAERHPVGQLVMRSSDLLVRSTLISNAAIRTGRNFAFKIFLPLPPIQSRVSENLSGLAINYRQQRKGRQWNNLLPGKHRLQSGDRIPDLELRPAVLDASTSASVHLYDLLRQAPYTLFIVLSPEYNEKDRSAITLLLDRITQSAGDRIQPLLVLEQGAWAQIRETRAQVYIDFMQQAHYKLQTQHGSILLIRPDAYLALRLEKSDYERCLSELERWIVPIKQADEAHLADIH